MDTKLKNTADGYRTEAPYPLRFHRELNPRRMALALAAQGVGAPSCDQPYTYMELGFGQGVSLVMLAAANPHAQFYGVDVMPEHVAHARGLAEAAGLSNLHVRQLSFADLDAQDWPAFDFIAAHGVWSWVTAPVRADVVRFVDGHLKSGGLLYLSYNAQPGWAAMEPLRAIMKRVFDEAEGTLDQKVQAALQVARGIEASQSIYFRANPTISVRLKQMESESAAYLAHEFFNAAWTPFHFQDVGETWAKVGLAFAASANLQDNVTDLTIRAEARPLYDGAKTIRARETLKDFLLNKQFRRDIYVREPRILDDAQLAATHAETRFAALMSLAQLADAKLTTEIMTVKLNATVHQALVAGLAGGPRTLAELCADPALGALNPSAAFGTLFLLSAMNAVTPAAADDVACAAAEASERLNAELARRAGTPAAIAARASSIIGGGLSA